MLPYIKILCFQNGMKKKCNPVVFYEHYHFHIFLYNKVYHMFLFLNNVHRTYLMLKLLKYYGKLKFHVFEYVQWKLC